MKQGKNEPLFDIATILKRGKNLDRKNGMFVYLLNKLPKIDSVLELYAGYGMQTFYIQKILKPTTHICYEIDSERHAFLKNKFPNVETYNTSSAAIDSTLFWNGLGDLCISDGYCFTNKTFDDDVTLLKNSGAKYYIVTNTGIFHAKFEKGGYGGNIQHTTFKLVERGIHHIATIYSGNYGLMLLSDATRTTLNNTEIRRYNDSLKDNSWREIFCDKSSVV